MAVVEVGKEEETPPTSHTDSLGVVVAGVEAGERMEAEVEVEVRRKPPNETYGLVGGGSGRCRGGREEEPPNKS